LPALIVRKTLATVAIHEDPYLLDHLRSEENTESPSVNMTALEIVSPAD
jgi:hypothetical protein